MLFVRSGVINNLKYVKRSFFDGIENSKVIDNIFNEFVKIKGRIDLMQCQD